MRSAPGSLRCWCPPGRVCTGPPVRTAGPCGREACLSVVLLAGGVALSPLMWEETRPHHAPAPCDGDRCPVPAAHPRHRPSLVPGRCLPASQLGGEEAGSGPRSGELTRAVRCPSGPASSENTQTVARGWRRPVWRGCRVCSSGRRGPCLARHCRETEACAPVFRVDL